MVDKVLTIPIQESILFLLINIVMILMGIILWYYIWIKQYGGEIPNPQFASESNISYFSSKNFVFLIKHNGFYFPTYERVAVNGQQPNILNVLTL